MAKPPNTAKKAAHHAKPAKSGAAAKNGNGAGKGAKAERPAPKVPAKPAKAVAKPAPPPPPPPKVNKAQSELAGKVVHMIAEDMAIEEAELTPAASFKEDLGLDEIDVAELLMQAEHAFGVHPFSEADWESCETVDDFVQLIIRRVEAKRGKKASKA